MSFLAFAITQSQTSSAPASVPITSVAVIAMVGFASTMRVSRAGENAETILLSIMT